MSCVLLSSAPVVTPAADHSPPMVITTDTPQYCQTLLERISELVGAATSPPPAEVDSLSREGRRLCDEGHTRQGILRLRRAIVLLERQPPPQ